MHPYIKELVIILTVVGLMVFVHFCMIYSCIGGGGGVCSAGCMSPSLFVSFLGGWICAILCVCIRDTNKDSLWTTYLTVWWEFWWSSLLSEWVGVIIMLTMTWFSLFLPPPLSSLSLSSLPRFPRRPPGGELIPTVATNGLDYPLVSKCHGPPVVLLITNYLPPAKHSSIINDKTTIIIMLYRNETTCLCATFSAASFSEALARIAATVENLYWGCCPS